MSKKLIFPEGKPTLSCNQLLPEVFQYFANKIAYNIPIDFSIEGSFDKEEFKLELKQSGAIISGSTFNGLFYGLQTLITHILESNLTPIDIKLKPLLPQRGLKLYLPSPTEDGFKEFYAIIDFAARFKFNTIILELGGALEYTSHPKINQAWIEYCLKMAEYPGKTLDIQNNSPWHKNSIHSENGGGKFLTQKEFLQLVTYCKERYMTIIPEMPSLSHSDYILAAYPNLAERKEDLYPDTCCPLNTQYHKVYQDLLDEVINLLHPEKIHIGHDEYYSVGLCPKCKGKEPHVLYANDINRICKYLEKKHIQPIIWGEKLLNSHWLNKEAIGGAKIPPKKDKEGVPAFYKAANLITSNIEIFHWYWNVDRKLEDVYLKHNWKFSFANFNPSIVKDWQRRVQYASGVIISNWGQTNVKTIQRNGVFYDLAYAAMLLWDKKLSSEDYPFINNKVVNLLYKEFTPKKPDTRILEVEHVVQTNIEFKYFFDGYILDEKEYFLGSHVFYSEKTKVTSYLPVIFGTNISNASVSDVRYDSPSHFADAYICDNQYKEVSCTTLPKKYNDTHMTFICRYCIPKEDDDLKYLRFDPYEDNMPKVRLINYKIL